MAVLACLLSEEQVGAGGEMATLRAKEKKEPKVMICPSTRLTDSLLA
jgi:hypothetical protein